MNKNVIAKVFVIVAVTALLGEFRISPFDSSFRFGLGSAGFFFLLLFYNDLPYRITGLMTGIVTTLFRISLEYGRVDSFSFFESLQTHFPIIGYYFTFALLLELIKHRTYYFNPLILVIWGAFCDGISNIVELLIIDSLTPNDIFGSVETMYVITIAVVRSFFVIGLFTIFRTSKLNAVYQEQRNRFEEIQTILSELYIEGFYLKKTLNDIEAVTAKGHSLYQKLKGSSLPSEVTTLALDVAQELHEVKKDNQRILAGIEKVINDTNTDKKPITLADIIDFSVHSNRKYVDYLHKNVIISVNRLTDMEIAPVYPILVIMNNLVSNAIEAIPNKGEIQINIKVELDYLVIEIIDNGSGIAPDEQEVIFEPGYTTKFDETGKASTGIGLSHVQSMTKELGGKIEVVSSNENTAFIIHLPLFVVKEKR